MSATTTPRHRGAVGTADDAGELATRLRLAVGRLARQLRQHAVGGLTASQYSALASIERMQPVRLGDLAAVEAVAPPSLTRVVASLEERDLAQRTIDADDRRAVRITLTGAGTALINAVRSERTAFLAGRVAGLDAADAAALRAALPVLERLVEDGR